MVDYRINDEEFSRLFLTKAELDGDLVGDHLLNWGLNSSGQIGDGTTANKLIPTQTTRAGTGWKQVAAGSTFSAAIDIAGKIWSQGTNAVGELGTGALTASSNPVQTVAAGYDWSQVAAGQTVSAGIKKDGTLWTWGKNYDGTLGDKYWPTNGPTAYSPVPVRGTGTWSSVVYGGSVFIGIKTDNTLWSWGTGSRYLGLNGVSATYSPTQIGALSGWKQVSAGSNTSHVAAVKLDGTLWTWGENTWGALGLGDTVDRSSPTQVPLGSSNWNKVAVGDSHTLAIRDDGTLWAWGANGSGELGIGTTVATSSPIQVGTDANWYTIACGAGNSAATKSDGTLWVWGQHQADNNAPTSSPVQSIVGGTDWTSVVCGLYHTIGVKSNGTIWTFGGGPESGGNHSPDIQLEWLNDGVAWTNISATYGHTMGVKADGTMWAFGTDAYGELGVTTTAPGLTYSSPTINVTAQWYNWKDVTAGTTHLIATNSDDTVWMTGTNANGELGDSTVIGRSSLAQFNPYSNWKQLSMSRYTGAGIRSDGTLWTWGRGNAAELGVGIYNAAMSTPVQTTAGGNDWRQIAAVQECMLALKNDGTMWGWGNNQHGVMGDGTITTRSTPVQVNASTDWKTVHIHWQNAASIKNDDTLWVWGWNAAGQLADGTIVSKSSPIQVTGAWSSVSVGYRHMAGIKTDGTLWLWGENGDGQLGDDTAIRKSSPVQTVAGGSDWSQVVCGEAFTAGIKTNGTLWVWGYNWAGQLGDGTTISKSSPIQVGTATDWKKVATTASHIVGLKNDGYLWAWGKDAYGELAKAQTSYPNFSTTSNKTPEQLTDLGNDWIDVSCGYESTGAIKKDGSAWSWGRNTYAALGTGYISKPINPYPAPIALPNPPKAASVSGGQNFTVLVTTNGTLLTVGLNDQGQLGDNTTASKSSPVQTVAGGSNWKQASCGVSHAAAVKTDGSLWSWGSNGYGQLGDGTIISKSSPVQIVGTDWNYVTCGDYHTVGIKKDGTLWSWGNNTDGQLGNGTMLNTSSPVQTVAYGTEWKIASAGTSHTAALKTNGSLWLWGRATEGQLGHGLTVSTSSPVQTSVKGSAWKKISCGAQHTSAIQYGEKSLNVYFNFE